MTHGQPWYPPPPPPPPPPRVHPPRPLKSLGLITVELVEPCKKHQVICIPNNVNQSPGDPTQKNCCSTDTFWQRRHWRSTTTLNRRGPSPWAERGCGPGEASYPDTVCWRVSSHERDHDRFVHRPSAKTPLLHLRLKLRQQCSTNQPRQRVPRQQQQQVLRQQPCLGSRHSSAEPQALVSAAPGPPSSSSNTKPSDRSSASPPERSSASPSSGSSAYRRGTSRRTQEPGGITPPPAMPPLVAS